MAEVIHIENGGRFCKDVCPMCWLGYGLPMRDTIHGRWNLAPDAVTLIDAHHHLWDLQQNRHPWLCGDEQKEFFMGNYSPLKRNYLPRDYMADALGHNVLTTVHCEAEWDRADQVGETRWL